MNIEIGGGCAHEVEDLAFFLARGVSDLEFEHEAVELGFWEGVGTFLLERVLGGENDEGVGQFVRCFADGDLAFSHGLKEGALDLCGCPVDFVGEDEVGEERPLFGGELAGAWIVDQRSDEISWEKVRGELDALELGVDARGQGFYREGLCDAWDTFKEDVPIRQEANEEAVNEGLLSDDDARDFVIQGFDPLTGLGDLFGKFLRAGHRMEGKRGMVVHEVCDWVVNVRWGGRVTRIFGVGFGVI